MNGKETRPVVLVADDEPDHVALVAGLLERHGYAALPAGSSAEALGLASGDPPDAAVLDVMMGHLSEGFDLARDLRRQHPGDLPIFFLTGMDAVFDVRQEIGEDWIPGDRLLSKPLDPKELVEALDQVLQAPSDRS